MIGSSSAVLLDDTYLGCSNILIPVALLMELCTVSTLSFKFSSLVDEWSIVYNSDDSYSKIQYRYCISVSFCPSETDPPSRLQVLAIDPYEKDILVTDWCRTWIYATCTYRYCSCNNLWLENHPFRITTRTANGYPNEFRRSVNLELWCAVMLWLVPFWLEKLSRFQKPQRPRTSFDSILNWIIRDHTDLILQIQYCYFGCVSPQKTLNLRYFKVRFLVVFSDAFPRSLIIQPEIMGPIVGPNPLSRYSPPLRVRAKTPQLHASWFFQRLEPQPQNYPVFGWWRLLLVIFILWLHVDCILNKRHDIGDCGGWLMIDLFACWQNFMVNYLKWRWTSLSCLILSTHWVRFQLVTKEEWMAETAVGLPCTAFVLRCFCLVLL